jgi:hypothetical protein
MSVLAASGLSRPEGAAASVTHTAATNSLNRDIEPVIVKGAQFNNYLNRPVEDLFLYALDNETWTQIPVQVDEVASSGAYVGVDDEVLGSNDEIVFMAKDTGDQVITDSVPPGLPSDLGVWYEIAVTNPLSPTEQGWAYLVYSTEASQTFNADYVSFDSAQHRVVAESYSLGYATPRPWADYLTLGTSNVDILDRNKLRLFCLQIFVCPIKEESSIIPVPDALIKDGPVRTIVRSGRVLGYASMLSWSATITIPAQLAGDVRLSLDFAPAAAGSTFYNAAVPAGVTVDGAVDAVPDQPFSPWVQLSTDNGTLIQVADTSQLGSSLANYYSDQATFDITDTGDRLRYGEAGTIIANPPNVFRYDFSIFALADRQPNRGAEYASYFRRPLTTATVKIGEEPLPPLTESVFLPIVQQ